jgi:hypothetical protein
VAIIGAIIERGIEEGRFREIDPHHSAFAAVAPLLFSAIWRTTFERFDSVPLDAQAFVTQHVDTFLRGITVGSEP